MECSRKFVGNQYIVLDKTTNCTHDLINTPNSDHDLIFMVENYDLCVDNVNRTLQWKVEECHVPSARGNYVQIKHNDENHYVYCFPRKLKIKGHNPFSCDNQVYVVPRKTSFDIDGHPWRVNQSTYESKMNVAPEITKLLNERTIHHQISDPKVFTDLGKILKDEAEINKEIGWKTIATHPGTYISAILLLVIVILVIVVISVYYCFKKLTMNKRFRNMQDIFQTFNPRTNARRNARSNRNSMNEIELR